MKGNDIVIAGGVRTPLAKAGTAFKDVPAVELGRVALSGLLAKFDLDPKVVDEVVLGCVAQPADAANIARVVALQAGIPKEKPAITVQRNCASGMEAVSYAYYKIKDGAAKVMIAGGVESMSNIPLLYPKDYGEALWKLRKARTIGGKLGALRSFKLRHFKPIIGLELGLTDPICGLNMGQAVDRLAREMHISRKEQDEFSLLSHQRASKAMQSGRFAEEIVPVYLRHGKAVADDIGPRPNQTLEQLAAMKPFFDREFGTVTVGNSCPVTDGATALIVTTYDRAKSLGLEPWGVIRSHAYAGIEPERFAIAPAIASSLALDQGGLSLRDIGLIEINEAFAAVILGNERVFKSLEFAKERLGKSSPLGEIDRSRLNVNGGAIALGHPVGVSGARLVLTLLIEMRHRNVNLGLAAICIGGGQGGAMVLER
ncbi:MAG: thiolase family protein [Deltaproteobacteria bacterium]|nr:thiolase family protein [Deltaproteobacteria bacterium]